MNIVIITMALCMSSAVAHAQVDMQETVAMIKGNLASSKEHMKNLEWVETVTTYYKGEQKSKKQNMCYYALDGKLTKVETGASTDR